MRNFIGIFGVVKYDECSIDRPPPLGPEARLALRLYKGGHMFYFDPAARAAFTGDAAAFYRRQEAP